MTETLNILLDAKQFLDEDGFYNDDAKLIRFVCSDCDFYKPDEQALECFAFKIMKQLLRKGIVTPQEVLDALRE